MAQKPLPTLHVSDLGEDSCASKRHVQGSIVAGGMALENLDPESQPSALEPFQLLTTHGSQASGDLDIGERSIRLPSLQMGRNKTQTLAIP